MSSAFDFSSEDIRTIQNALMRATYASVPPIGKTLALHKDSKGYYDALGAEWYNLKGLDRLIAVSFNGSAMQPLDPLETLIAASVEPALFSDLRSMYFPNISANNWGFIDVLGGLHRSAQEREFTHTQQLTLYQWAAWNRFLGTSTGRDRDLGADIKVWDEAPTFVRTNALMQQIIALKSPVLLQECICREPRAAWNVYAVGLCLQRTGLSKQFPWYTIVDNEIFGQLVSPNIENSLILGRNNSYLYQFPENKLPILQRINPALFIHGVFYNRTLRDFFANEWFTPMLESVFRKTLTDTSYVNYLLSPREETPEQAKRFDVMLSIYCPDYMRLLSVYQSLHSGDTAYAKWTKGCAHALLEKNDSLELPDFNEPPSP